MYFNKVYSSSTEHIITGSPSNNTFDVELQHPQPQTRRRQIFDPNYVPADSKNEHHARAYSLPQKREEFHLSERGLPPSINNMVTLPANLPTISSAEPILLSSTPLVVEEK